MSESSDSLTCRKCGEQFQKGVDLSMHYRVVHTEPLQLGLAEKRDCTLSPESEHNG